MKLLIVRQKRTGLSLLAITLGIMLCTPAALRADQVIIDDIIVTGSACIGFDCVNGESFGFDTLRLKENNLRIKAQDTSNSASFPTRDWQITFNDSSNGGANKFSIDDIDGGRTPFTLEANAPSHSLYVDDGGRVGFGTSTPVVQLHTVDGNTPTLRLQQDGSSGFTPQTWDMAGNEANFFVRDATNGSTLPFRIYPGAPSDALTIEAATGDIGMGTTTPDADLEVERTSGDVTLRLNMTGVATWDFYVKETTGRFAITDDPTYARLPFKLIDGANNNLFKVGVDNSKVEINGELVVNGDITATGTITPDYVFTPEYKLMPIEEHARRMWDNSHLPHVSPASINSEGKGVINLTERSQGALEELEIAHIYIEQLHSQIKEIQQRLESLEKK